MYVLFYIFVVGNANPRIDCMYSLLLLVRRLIPAPFQQTDIIIIINKLMFLNYYYNKLMFSKRISMIETEAFRWQ